MVLSQVKDIFKGKYPKAKTRITMDMRLKLRNIKCVFIVKNQLLSLLTKFSLRNKYYIFRLKNKICLTIYPKSKFKIQVTGIATNSDYNCLLTFFELNKIEVSEVQINNTFWIIKPLNIIHFDKFAKFCDLRRRKGKVNIDLSNHGLNGDGGFLNAIYLRHSSCKGTIVIHRTSSLILGATTLPAIRMLKLELTKLLSDYINYLELNTKRI